jgi:hypothetical protein
MKKIGSVFVVAVFCIVSGFSQAKQAPQKNAEPGKNAISLDEVSRMLVGKWHGTHEDSKVVIWFYGKDRLLVSYEADEFKASKGKEYFVFELLFGDDVSSVVFDVIDEKHIVIDYGNSADTDVTYIDTCLLLEKE